MDKFKYLIVGGGVAGSTAAETIRQNDAVGSICIVNDEPYPLYSRIMLSKPGLFTGQIPVEQIWLRNADWYRDKKIELMGGRKAIGFDVQAKVVTLNDGSRLGYENLLIATGVCAKRWNVSGANKRGVFYMRTLEDGMAVIEAIKSAKRAVIIGGGFVSFEMADILKTAGLDVTVIILESYFWEPILDEDSAKIVEKSMGKAGVRILRRSEVQDVLGEDAVEGVLLRDGTKIPCDMIVCGIGVTCSLDWIKSSGINGNKGVLTNEYLETNVSGVWAAGDATEFYDVILEESAQMGSWVNAREQGRIAGLNMAGKRQPFKFVSFYTTQGFGVTLAFIGDVRPAADKIYINRRSPEIDSHARIIIAGKELVGATLLNRTKELSVLSKLIEQNIDVSEKHKELSSPDFDLKSLLI